MLLVCLVFNQLVTHAFETVLEQLVEHLQNTSSYSWVQSLPVPLLGRWSIKDPQTYNLSFTWQRERERESERVTKREREITTSTHTKLGSVRQGNSPWTGSTKSNTSQPKHTNHTCFCLNAAFPKLLSFALIRPSTPTSEQMKQKEKKKRGKEQQVDEHHENSKKRQFNEHQLSSSSRTRFDVLHCHLWHRLCSIARQDTTYLTSRRTAFAALPGRTPLI